MTGTEALKADLESALKRIMKLRTTLKISDRLLMEANHVLSFAQNKGIAGDRLKERIRQHLTRTE